MQLIETVLPMTHNFFLGSDPHEGTILQHRDGIKQFVSKVLEERNNVVALLGDLAEGITVDDLRYDRDMVDPDSPLPLLQYQEMAKRFWDVRDRIKVVLEGNHDIKISNRFGNGVKNVFCKELEIPEAYGTFSTKLIVRDTKGRLMYKMFLTHGAKSISSVADDPIRREANMKLQLKRRLNKKAGDCAIMAMGHTHQLLVCPPSKELYLIDDGKRVRQAYTGSIQNADYIAPEHRWYVNTGSFYKLYAMGVSGYAERFGYDPNELGYAVVRVVDGVIKDIERVVLN